MYFTHRSVQENTLITQLEVRIPFVPDGNAQVARGVDGVIDIDCGEGRKYSFDEIKDNFLGRFIPPRILVPAIWVGAIELSGERHESTTNFWVVQHRPTDIDRYCNAGVNSPMARIDRVWFASFISVDYKKRGRVLRHFNRSLYVSRLSVKRFWPARTCKVGFEGRGRDNSHPEHPNKKNLADESVKQNLDNNDG